MCCKKLRNSGSMCTRIVKERGGERNRKLKHFHRRWSFNLGTKLCEKQNWLMWNQSSVSSIGVISSPWKAESFRSWRNQPYGLTWAFVWQLCICRIQIPCFCCLPLQKALVQLSDTVWSLSTFVWKSVNALALNLFQDSFIWCIFKSRYVQISDHRS